MPHAVSRREVKDKVLASQGTWQSDTQQLDDFFSIIKVHRTILIMTYTLNFVFLQLCPFSFTLKVPFFLPPSGHKFSCTPLLRPSTSLTPKRFLKNLLKFICYHKINTCDAFVVFRGHVQSGNKFESSSTHIPSWDGAKQRSPFLCPLSYCRQVSFEMSL